MLAIGVLVMGLQRMCRAVKAPFLPQSPNFEAYESKVAAIVLDATDLLVCFIQCLTGRNCSLGRSLVASDVFLACEEVSLSRCANVYSLRFCIFNDAVLGLPLWTGK